MVPRSAVHPNHNHHHALTDTSSMPPLIHAVGGSLGSALALLLLYPLERARIDMQASTAAGRSSRTRRNHRSVRQQQGGGASLLHSPIPTAEQGKQQEALIDQEHFVAATTPFLHPEVEESGSASPSSSESWTLPGTPQSTSRPSSPPDDNDDSTDAPSEAFCDAQSQLIEDDRDDDNEELDQEISLVQCLKGLAERKELYRGVAPLVLTLGLSNFVFFYVNEFIKRLIRSLGPSTSRSGSLVASCLAGIVNVLVTNPLWVVNLRLVVTDDQDNNRGASTNKTSMMQEMRTIVQTQGWRHLWTGTTTSILLVSNPVIQFFLYEQFKVAQLVRNVSAARSSSTSLSPPRAFVTGALAKAIATVVTYPLQLTQAVLRMQKTTTSNVDKDDDNDATSTTTTVVYKDTWDCLRKLYQERGLTGLYTGMRAKMLQTVLTAAFTFLTYEQILRVVYTVVHSSSMSIGMPQQKTTRR